MAVAEEGINYFRVEARIDGGAPAALRPGMQGVGKVLVDDPENPQTPDPSDDSLSRGELLNECPACGYAGDYRMRINGFYIDFSWDWN